MIQGKQEKVLYNITTTEKLLFPFFNPIVCRSFALCVKRLPVQKSAII